MEKTASEIVMVKKNVQLQEWNRQIEEQKSSGLSIQDWCKQKGKIPSISEKKAIHHIRCVIQLIISRSGKHRDALRKATAHGEESSKTGKESGNSPKESTSFIME